LQPATYIERQFQNFRQISTAPIGALARYNEEEDTPFSRRFIFA
jgi:hypothetical protein